MAQFCSGGGVMVSAVAIAEEEIIPSMRLKPKAVFCLVIFID
jgi:hypothetical protein